MVSEKVVGYMLLSVGLVVILFSAFSVYQIFTKKTIPVQLFNFNPISLNLSGLVGDLPPAQKAVVKPVEIIPASTLNESANVAAHMFLMGFLATIGYRIASLGVQMVRTIVVKQVVKSA